MSPARLALIDEVMRRAIADGGFPGGWSDERLVSTSA